MASSSLLRGRILPTIVFPALTGLAFKLLFGRLLAAGVRDVVGVQCQPTPGFSPQTFTGVNAIDQQLCGLVAFFGILMHDHTGLTFLSYAIGTGAPLVLLPTFEAYRKGQSILLKYPVVWLLLSQLATVGATYPLYWLTFVLAGGPQRSRNAETARSHTQAEALAMVFGLLIGVIVPSVAMLILDDPVVTALWQIYPAFFAIAQVLHLQFRSNKTHSHSGYTTLQVLFIGIFVMSSSMHISTVWPLINNFAELKAALLPSIYPLDAKADVAMHLIDFLKWDMVLGFASTAIATLWFASSAKQLAAFIVWYAFAIPVFGPGAAITGIAIWRYGFLG